MTFYKWLHDAGLVGMTRREINLMEEAWNAADKAAREGVDIQRLQSALISLAAQMARRQNMPSPEDWQGFSKPPTRRNTSRQNHDTEPSGPRQASE